MQKLSNVMATTLIMFLSGSAIAEGDGAPLTVRAGQGAAVQWASNKTLPAAARRAVLPDVWRNAGAIACAPTDTNAAGVTYCSNFATHRFTTDNRDTGRYILQLRAPASHCSPIIYVAYIDVADGSTTPYYFGALYPGASSARVINVRPGAHTISIGALGDTGMGGCNTSGIQSWSVDVRLEADNAPG